MEIGTHLLQHQTVQLHMTQELAQAISLLQFSAVELASFIEELVTENPLVEVETTIHSPVDPISLRGKSGSSSSTIFEPVSLSGGPSLYDHLYEQLLLLPLSEAEQRIIHFFILNINENGYLEISVEEASALLGITVTEGKRMVDLLQQLDPPGVGARHLQECLLIQLKRLFPTEHRFVQIFSQYFRELAEKKWKKIAKREGITYFELQQLMDTVQQLDPKPGAKFSDKKPSYVTPDVSIEKRSGKWHIQLTEDRYFRFRFNEPYYNRLLGMEGKELAEFVKRNAEQYQWIRRSMDQRRKTLRTLVETVIKRQEPFLSGITDEMRPMTMREVAQSMNVHESTVSRTVKNKFIQTPARTIPLKALFTHSVEGGMAGGEISTDYIKRQLATIIDDENKREPLSDQEIVQLLKKKEIHISRRTVAKYREQLRIPPSMKRKRYD